MVWWYACGMEYTDYLLYKFIALVAIVFFVNLIYAAVTGRSIEQERFDKQSGPTGSPDRAAPSRADHQE